MEKPNVINFSNFFESGEKRAEFKREDFKDFFVSESGKEIETDDLELQDEMMTDDDGTGYFPDKEYEKVPDEDGMLRDDDGTQYFPDEEYEKVPDEDGMMTDDDGTEYFPDEEYKSLKNEDSFMVNENYYPLYRDKPEVFSCDVSVEGAKISDTSVRLIVESDEWTLMFPGEVDSKGKCSIQIKKLNLFNEGTVGKIRLEVIAENTVFIPWEDEFKVKMSKKVEVKVNESKSVPKRNEIRKPGVKVNVRR